MSDMKQCTKCGQWKPATVEYFKKNKDRITSPCRECCNLAAKTWRDSDPERVKETHRKHRNKHKQERNEYSRRYYVTHRDMMLEYHKRYYATHRDERLEYNRRYRVAHRDEFIEYRKRYRDANRDILRERCRQRRIADPESAREQVRRYQAKNKDVLKTVAQRRRARKRQLPDTFTTRDWQRALDYFGGCCAYCGRQADFWTVISPDHFIALKDPRPDNPGTVAANIIPACHAKKDVPAGEPCCNNSKTSKDPVAWMTQRFGKKRADEILERISAYFEWVRQQQ